MNLEEHEAQGVGKKAMDWEENTDEVKWEEKEMKV